MATSELTVDVTDLNKSGDEGFRPGRRCLLIEVRSATHWFSYLAEAIGDAPLTLTRDQWGRAGHDHAIRRPPTREVETPYRFAALREVFAPAPGATAITTTTGTTTT